MGFRIQSHIFWGINSPLSALTGLGLLVMASGRIVSAFVCTFALAWINILTMTAVGAGRRVFPEKGGGAVLCFTASFAALLFFFIVWLVSPFSAMENMFIIVLCPAFLLNSGLYIRVKNYDIPEMILQAAAEAFVLGILIFAAALIREPLGSGSFSVPGLELIRLAKDAPFAVLQGSSGILIILGYGIALYRYLRNRQASEERD